MKIGKYAACFAILLSGTTGGRVLAVEQIGAFLEKSDVFAAGMNGIAAYRIPGVVVTPKGTVLAYCEARKNSRKDYGEIEVHLRRSVDGGKTWEDPIHIAHSGERIGGHPRAEPGKEHEQTVNNPVAIIDSVAGAVEFLYCINYERVFSMRSMDDGLTWSTPVEITEIFEPFRKDHDLKVVATGPGHGIQLRSGRLVVPVWMAYGDAGEHWPSVTAVIYSDDHGKTWKAGDIAVPNNEKFNNPNETMITELSDGRVMLLTRNVSHPNRKLVTFSENGADGWSDSWFHPELPEPVCMASIISHPVQPGTHIFSGPDSVARDPSGNEEPGGRGRRRNLTIKLSRDNGKTWPVSRTLEPGNSAYSDLAVLPDGTVICFYEAGSRLTAARFNLAWLTDK